MSAALRRRALALFMEVVQLPAIERAAALDARCAGEPELRAAVDLLEDELRAKDDDFEASGAKDIIDVALKRSDSAIANENGAAGEGSFEADSLKRGEEEEAEGA